MEASKPLIFLKVFIYRKLETNSGVVVDECLKLSIKTEPDFFD